MNLTIDIQAMAFNEVANLIKKDLKLDLKLKPKDVIKLAADALSEEEQLVLLNLGNTKDKLDYIAECLELI